MTGVDTGDYLGAAVRVLRNHIMLLSEPDLALADPRICYVDGPAKRVN